MEPLNKTTELNVYDTAINIIGGLKDCSVLIKAIESHFSQTDTLKDPVSQRNEFNLRTERSRIRIEREVRKIFYSFQMKNIKNSSEAFLANEFPYKISNCFLFGSFH